MDVVLYEFLVDVPRAAAIWSALLVLALTVLTVLVARPEREPAATPSPSAVPDEGAADPDPVDLRRYAEEVAVAAAGAAHTAHCCRADWLTAQDRVDEAWQAYDEAETAARRLAGVTVLPVPHVSRTPTEYAARERYLHRAAMAAYWRGELSVGHLGDVFAGRKGWDPRLHQVDQEAVLHRVLRDLRRADYRTAVDRERAAWQRAEVAATAARCLTEEAYLAAEQVWAGSRAAVDAARPASGTVRPTVDAPRPASGAVRPTVTPIPYAVARSVTGS
ncbi:hypothetical protein GA0074692_3263 [Micromonospora pallida]|uniref:Uncharacterized protein n=1 Tax=Micromonospora pallida TaxID=145854 RepID=A0A1C6SRP0_9ACTN|nr:hypothetical protein [Micromonospora pallida]SCL32226.1 hypothetical protein GA0074692_3263 [Micromonospora pallida]